jgi:uncharacterized protein
LQRIGTLTTLRRYPVKSMAGEDLQEARVAFSGLTGDRVYAFMETENRTSFPGMTARHGHEWILVNDARPVSIFGLATVRGLSEETKKYLDPRCFRANLYVQWDDDRPFFEDTLVGRQLRIGETITVLALEKDARCIMITLDPTDATPFPKLLETVSGQHSGCAGIRGTFSNQEKGGGRNGQNSNRRCDLSQLKFICPNRFEKNSKCSTRHSRPLATSHSTLSSKKWRNLHKTKKGGPLYSRLRNSVARNGVSPI